MSFNRPLNLDRTVLDVTISYDNPLFLSQPIILNDASGENNIMTISADNQQVITATTSTGDNDAYMQAVLLRGEITLHPQSPAIPQISKLISDMELLTLPSYGQVTISKPGTEDVVFTAFMFTNPNFTGFNYARSIEDYVVPFSCRAPKGYNLSSIANTTGGLVNLV